jgi:predicted dehydrogenase
VSAGSRPRVGFLGLGWIGRHRLEAAARSGCVDIIAVADAVPAAADAALDLAPGARRVGSYAELLALDCDGVVIATPSAMHADQAVMALESGCAVFCQKPLGRSADETARVLAAARQADRLLAVDMSYRHVEAFRAAHRLVTSGELGRVYAADLVFHNAYGPDKPWFYERSLSGGGCVIDLGIHLVDLALWNINDEHVTDVSARLFAGGTRLEAGTDSIEDYAVATLDCSGGAVVRLACSWKLPAGQDAVISAEFFGTAGSVAVRNVGGSFYDFRATRARGTRTEVLSEPPDDWGGRAIVAWAGALASGARFDPQAAHLLEVARTIDRIYDECRTGVLV